MTVFLRNRHPKRALAIPCNGHWCRLLPAGATSALPDATLRHPVTRLLLAKQLVLIVDATQYDADARQERAGRTDIAELARQMEQAEFDNLFAGLTLPRPGSYCSQTPGMRRAGEWSEAQVALLRRRHAAGMTWSAIAVELGRAPGAVAARARREGLRRPRQPPPGKWPPEWTETLKRRRAERLLGP